MHGTWKNGSPRKKWSIVMNGTTVVLLTSVPEFGEYFVAYLQPSLPGQRNDLRVRLLIVPLFQLVSLCSKQYEGNKAATVSFRKKRRLHSRSFNMRGFLGKAGCQLCSSWIWCHQVQGMFSPGLQPDQRTLLACGWLHVTAYHTHTASSNRPWKEWRSKITFCTPVSEDHSLYTWRSKSHFNRKG